PLPCGTFPCPPLYSRASIHPCLSALYLYPPLLHPHPSPFPTRRSSDLPDYIYLPFVGSEYRISRQTGEVERLLSGCQAPEHGNEDRKSTRLNSSHVSISYAVFCLKKKNPCDQSQPCFRTKEQLAFLLTP